MFAKGGTCISMEHSFGREKISVMILLAASDEMQRCGRIAEEYVKLFSQDLGTVNGVYLGC
jgi:hypothetical protein